VAAPFRSQARQIGSEQGDGERTDGASTMFEIVGAILQLETIAVGRGIRELKRLEKAYGKGHWRKRKGVARIRLANGRVHTAEIHFYEAHGIGRKEAKVKRLYR
jgi:hypothetical protein